MDAYFPETASPLFSDLSSANKEIMRLRRQLYQTNVKHRDAVERCELVKRAHAGNVKALKEEYEARLKSYAEGQALLVIERDQARRLAEKLEASLVRVP